MRVTISRDKLREIITKHEKWLNGKKDGVRADVFMTDPYETNLQEVKFFSWANCQRADLYEANLQGVDLKLANLQQAIFEKVNLQEADLFWTDLQGANLYRANLCGANLHGAKLFETNLYGANLREAKIDKLAAARLMACPSEGAFTAWKKVGRYIIKLLIPEDAKRSSATTRKCRCSKAQVLAIENFDGSAADVTKIEYIAYDHMTVYEIGKTVEPDSFDNDRWNECSHGIHFFITREEAVAYD